MIAFWAVATLVVLWLVALAAMLWRSHTIIVAAQLRRVAIARLMHRHVTHLVAGRSTEYMACLHALCALAWAIDPPSLDAARCRDDITAAIRVAIPGASDDDIAIGAVYALAVSLSMAIWPEGVIERPQVIPGERVH